jgi:hypothetical protein
MHRVATAFLFASSLFLAGAPARAQTQSQDAAALNVSEAVCVGQNIGSACDSSTTTAGGTCLAGCCCHYVTDPEGTSVCEPCLACSDTSSLDPAYSPGACSDGGTLLSADSGAVVPIEDGGGTTPVQTPTGTPAPTSSSGGCSNAGGAGADPSIAMLLLGLGAIAVATARRSSRVPR